MLPLNLDLTGRRVVAVGGGPVSARRVRAFVEAGARVHVVAPRVCDEIKDLGNEVAWHPREVRDGDLDGAWLVHTASGDPEVDRRIGAEAERRRIWCVNASAAERGSAAVPATATAQTPEAAVTVAVSSGDPGRSVRVRDTVANLLAVGPVDLRPRRTRRRGWVALVGAGPGDDDLLTVRAHRLLRSADVVVADRLIPREVLAVLPADVEIVDVGKTPGNHPVPQDQINRLLVEQASLGKGVVRLKGGDPYVLGRGEEERLACAAAGVRVEVVPGVTSAIAVPAAAGIPVTHRGVSRGFTVVTGHDQIAAVPGGSDHTVIVLMGVAGLRRTAAQLIEHGRDHRTPVALIERGCTPEQRVSVGVLGDIAEVAQRRRVTSPAIIIVGDVVRLGPDWSAATPGRAA